MEKGLCLVDNVVGNCTIATMLSCELGPAGRGTSAFLVLTPLYSLEVVAFSGLQEGVNRVSQLGYQVRLF